MRPSVRSMPSPSLTASQCAMVRLLLEFCKLVNLLVNDSLQDLLWRLQHRLCRKFLAARLVPLRQVRGLARRHRDDTTRSAGALRCNASSAAYSQKESCEPGTRLRASPPGSSEPHTWYARLRRPLYATMFPTTRAIAVGQ